MSTWVELALRSQKNKEKLGKLLDRSRRAYVVVEGEFYGPPLPDPKLPEPSRTATIPGGVISRRSRQNLWYSESTPLSLWAIMRDS